MGPLLQFIGGIYPKESCSLRRIALLSVVLAVLGACAQAKQSAPLPQPPEVTVGDGPTGSGAGLRPTFRDATSAYLVAQVRARVDGIVQKRGFRKAPTFRAGQRLYQIDPAPYRATLDSALAALQKAQANLAAMSSQAERYRILIGGNGVSKQEYDNAIAAQAQAAADVASSEAAVQTAASSRLYRRRIPDHRPHRPFTRHPGRVRAGERRDSDGDGPSRSIPFMST